MNNLKKILVTGGSGYAGSALIPLLLEKGYAVRVVGKNDHADIGYFDFSNNKLEYVCADLTDKEKIKEVLKGVDLVVHLAGLVGENICRENPDLAKRVNVDMVKNLESVRGEIPLVFISSSSVYGGKNKIICNEKTKPNPEPGMVYAETKLESEKIVLAGKKWIVLRPATLFGFSLAVNYNPLVNNFVWQSVKNKKLEIYNDGLARTFIHVNDLANIILMMLERFDKFEGEIFNAGSNDMNFTKRQVAETIKKFVDFDLKMVESADPDKRDFIVNYDKIAEAGYQKEFSLERGVRELIDKIL